MSTATAPAPIGAITRSGPSLLSLTLRHAKFSVLETIRTPIAVVGNLLFPTLAMFFFVVPQASVAGNPLFATAAVGQLAMFSVMSTFLFTFGSGVAEDRALPFEGYIRTLPAGAAPRMLGRVLAGCLYALVSLIPLGVGGALFTQATAPPATVLLAALMVLVVGLPFLMLGLAIGYRMSSKAAIAVVQAVLFPLAFAGGLFLPAEIFPSWLNTLSQALPSRAGRDLLIQVLTGQQAYALALPVLIAWGLLFTALAVLAYRRDEGRRFN
ncbi:ABC transporter permease [Occultella kanbiaonis]|uniref:ABC transporter permease n=1 Tax=Occultella kanbiaonis TaxID=2675754 RepID=UPI0013D8B99D|nr:ABC transporter permease [Occultella kanbiaonis]